MRKILRLILAAAVLLPLASCLGDNDTDLEKKYGEWKKTNEEFVEKAAAERNADGTPVYERIVPDWSKDIYVLMRWHNDRSLTEKNLVPLDNSTCAVKYTLMLADSTIADASHKNYADSIYSCMPKSNVPGFWTALTHMHVGDSVTVVVPWKAGYGTVGTTGIKPFSTLIFSIKLKEITAYQKK